MMRHWVLALSRLLLALAAASCAAASLALSPVSAFLAQALSKVSALSGVPVAQVTAWMLFGAVAIPLAIVTLLILGHNAGRRLKFAVWPYVAALGPGVSAHSSVDWLRYIRQTPYHYAPPAFALTLGLALATVAFLLLLYLATRWREDINGLAKSGVELADTRLFVRGSAWLAVALVGAALLLTGVVLGMAFAIVRVGGPVLTRLPWPLLVLGLGAVATIAAVAYRFVAHADDQQAAA